MTPQERIGLAIAKYYAERQKEFTHRDSAFMQQGFEDGATSEVVKELMAENAIEFGIVVAKYILNTEETNHVSLSELYNIFLNRNK